MSILKRVKHMVQADAHAVLDNIEEPSALLKQALREMQAALNSSELEIQELSQEHVRQSSNLAALQKELEEIEQELELCLSEGNEALAKHVLKNKLSNRFYAKSTMQQIDNISERLSNKQVEFNEQSAKFSALQLRVHTLDQKSIYSTEDSLSSTSTLFQPISDEQLDLELLKEKQKRRLP